MEKKDEKVFLPNVDSLFRSQRSKEKTGDIRTLSIKDIDNFPNHPFRVIVEEDDSILESIKNIGVKTPVLVRPKENGRYELISGHRRKMASEMLGIDTIPCVVQELTDDEATILMVDSNFQREKILPSEKAFAYKLKMEALKHQGKETLRPMVNKLKTADIIGKDNNDSGRQVQRYIRLTELIPKILDMVDNEQIAFRPAVELSYLTRNEQQSLLDLMQCYDCTPSLSQAIKLKNHSKENTLTVEYMEKTLSETKPNQIPKTIIQSKRIMYPSYATTKKQKEEYVYNAVETYDKYNNILPNNLETDQDRLRYVARLVNFYDKYQQKKRERAQER